MRFQNKVVLVTGSSRGIGKATALLFAQEGAHIVINYIDEEEQAYMAVKEIEAFGMRAIAIQADVSREDDVKKMTEEAVSYFGGIDILINNAGIVFDVPILEKTVEQWKRTLEVNLIGTFLCTKYIVPHMKDREGAAVLNISSTNGINSLSPEAADYDASKSGIISLTKNFAQSLAPAIRVNSVAPGWVDTDINKDLPKEYLDEEIKKTALRRLAQPEEIAKAVLFLCSDDASFITGSVLVIDGGYQ